MARQDMTIAAQTFNAAERLERLPLTKYQLKIFVAIGLAWLFDIIDINMMTYALAPLQQYFRVSTAQIGLLGSISFAGMFVGATFSGLLGDKFGRKRIFQLSILIWGAASFLCACSANIFWLTSFRFLLGIGMGMEFPVGQSLVCELTPAKYRGRTIAALAGFIPLGAIVCGILALLILPIAGWRGLFFVQGILAILAMTLRRAIPESPRWLEQSGQVEQANAVLETIENGVSVALAGKPLPEPQILTFTHHIVQSTGNPVLALRSIWSSIYAKRTTMLWLVWFLVLLGHHGLKTWLASLLNAKGYSTMESTSYVLIMTLAGIPGFITSFYLVERWGRKPALVATLVGMAIAFCLYGHASNLREIITYGLITQFFVFAMWCPLYVYTPELYPTNTRATGSGCASALGRFGGILGPALVGIILPTCGQFTIFAGAAGLFVLAALTILILGEETKGRLLENISPPES
jgi:putative MFS transporter